MDDSEYGDIDDAESEVFLAPEKSRRGEIRGKKDAGDAEELSGDPEEPVAKVENPTTL